MSVALFREDRVTGKKETNEKGGLREKKKRKEKKKNLVQISFTRSKQVIVDISPNKLWASELFKMQSDAHTEYVLVKFCKSAICPVQF